MTDWFPFSTAPSTRDFLVHFTNGYIARGRLLNGKFLAADSHGPSKRSFPGTIPTHWAELPEPPVEHSAMKVLETEDE